MGELYKLGPFSSSFPENKGCFVLDIHPFALKVIKTLSDAGYTTYLAGGCVRDHLLGLPETDIDVATSAPPEKVEELFSKTVSVGASFGVVVVVGEEISVEVASFRKDGLYLNGRHPEKIEFSTPEEDAARRDFTINGMFYDPLNDQVIDFVEGRSDLKEGIIRAIGNPFDRFAEDRLRMVRAVRFSIRFNFPIEEKTVDAIKKNATTLLPAVSMERIWAEIKLMRGDEKLDRAMVMLHDLGLLQSIFPELSSLSSDELKTRIKSYSHLSEKVPTVLFVQELFPGKSREEREDLCRYLKVSGNEIKLSQMFSEIDDLVDREGVTRAKWARVYAKEKSLVCLEVIAARTERFEQLNHHRNQMKELEKHIERIRYNRPVVSSKCLKAEGIPSGKNMGLLLGEAEQIAIDSDLDDPQKVIEILKTRAIWPRI